MIYKNKMLKIIILIILITPISSCVTINSMQSGKTLGNNNAELCLSGTYGNYSPISVFYYEDTVDVNHTINNFPNAGLRVRYGITNKIDLGLNFDLTTDLGLNLKYQFLGTKTSFFCSSIGFDTGINLVPAIAGGFSIYYLSIPLFISIHPKKNVSIYFTPRYFYTSRYFFGYLPPNYNERFKANISRNLNSYGIIIGETHNIAFEISNFGEKFYLPTQFTIGYIYHFNKIKLIKILF